MKRIFLTLSLIGFANLFLVAQRIETFQTNNRVKVSASISQYDILKSNSLIKRQDIRLTHEPSSIINDSSKWQIFTSLNSNSKNEVEIAIKFICTQGFLENSSLSVNFSFSNWNVGNYLLMPGTVYNGNRYPTVKMDYPPFAISESQLGVKHPLLLSEQPQLNPNNGFSRIQERSASMSIPSVGFRDAQAKKGFWMWFDQGNELGDFGVDVAESDDRSNLVISLTSPMVREREQYHLNTMGHATSDVPANFKKGDTVIIKFSTAFFDCLEIQNLFDYHIGIRNRHYSKEAHKNITPFSICYRTIQDKFNKENWNNGSYYADEGNRFPVGWTGGLISLYALYSNGDSATKSRVLENLKWFFDHGQTASGYWADRLVDGNIKGILQGTAIGGKYPMLLARKNADATYYLFKLFEQLKKNSVVVPKEWESKNLSALKAQLGTWKKYGQTGHFVNYNDGSIILGNTTSAAIFPASLCKAFQLTGDSSYLKFAIDIADYFYEEHVKKGVTSGGPGDALQSPDSESAYGLLEGFVQIYGVTKSDVWLKRSREMANQFASWVIGVNYKFPPNSPWGKLDMKSMGGIYANTQNKTGTAGICTHSGSALLDLYRVTGEEFYLDLISNIAHAIPQYMSSPLRPIPGYNLGWISERISLNDWNEGIGETLYKSTWAETAMMLTAIELPGIFVDTDKNTVIALDHVEVKILKSTGKRIILSIFNPTGYDAAYKVELFSMKKTGKKSDSNGASFQIVNVKRGERISLTVNK